MSATYIILIVVVGVTLLLLMVLKFKLNAFIALLITSIVVGVMAGMPLQKISASIQEGMGSTLGFVATVVGLGAIFGQMLESSGGAKSLAHYLLKKFGKNRASWALMLTGFISVLGGFIYFPLGQLLAWITGAGLSYVIMVVNWFGSKKWAAVDFRLPLWGMAVIYGAMIFCIIKYKKIRKICVPK